VNATGPDGATALHWAVWFDDVATAELLIAAGAKVSTPNIHGVAPLPIACTNASAKMVALLLNAGADPNWATPEGETALMTAARAGNKQVVTFLLDRGANVNAAEKWRGQTALMWAAAEGHTDVVEELVRGGADWKARSKVGFDAFLFAVREGRSDVVRSLLKSGANVNDVLPPRTPRRTGASELGAQEPGVSALDLAVSNAHFELASVLLDAGADPNHAGPGWTPLHTMTWVRKPGTGSNDPAPPGSGSMTSLELVRKLVAKGADVNARMTRRTNAGASAMNMSGATPLLMAARTADAELMRLLVQLGADPKLTNADKSNVLMIAAGLGTRSPGEDAGTEAEVLEAVKAALEFGIDPNAVDENGETALHGAAYKHLPQVAKYLASHGARIEVWNRKNKNGWTPLRIATGVQRTANFRTSPVTAAAIREIMEAAGVSTALESETTATR
jgi:ankyrin repeat protein